MNRLSKVLGLRRCIIGLRFLYFKRDYIEENIPEYGRKTSYCMMVEHRKEIRRAWRSRPILSQRMKAF